MGTTTYIGRVRVMRTKRLVICLLVSLLSVGWVLTVQAAPQIAFEQTSFDCGDVQANATVTHTFTFKNTGDALLKIESVHSP